MKILYCSKNKTNDADPLETTVLPYVDITIVLNGTMRYVFNSEKAGEKSKQCFLMLYYTLHEMTGTYHDMLIYDTDHKQIVNDSVSYDENYALGFILQPDTVYWIYVDNFLQCDYTFSMKEYLRDGGLTRIVSIKDSALS